MRLLLVHQAFALPEEGGGTRHYELFRRFTEAGHEAVVIASPVSYLSGSASEEKPRRQLYLGGRLEVLRARTLSGIHRNFLWRLLGYFYFMTSSVWMALRAPSPDVIMGTSPPLPQALGTALVALVRRRPFLLEVRDLWPDFAIDMGILRNPVLIWLSRLAESFVYWSADHILVNSPAYRTYMIERGIPEDKVSLIPNGVDTSMFQVEQSREELREELGWSERFVSIYTGALGTANDIDTILGAAERLRDDPRFLFAFAGSGKEEVRLRKLAEGMELENVQFLGVQPKDRIAELLKASDLCLATLLDIPMFRTTYPNKVFDYMAAGRPTLLAIDGVIREVVEASDGGRFVQPGDPLALGEAVREMAEDPEECRAQGERARTYVEAHFDRAAHAAAFTELLEEMAPGT